MGFLPWCAIEASTMSNRRSIGISMGAFVILLRFPTVAEVGYGETFRIKLLPSFIVGKSISYRGRAKSL